MWIIARQSIKHLHGLQSRIFNYKYLFDLFLHCDPQHLVMWLYKGSLPFRIMI